jgi:predicted membrane-bound mannosyltransferase
LGWQTWQLDTAYAADQRNPHVYAHTSLDFANLAAKLDRLLQASGQGNSTLIKVVAPDDDYWPLPWYLRTIRQVGWYQSLPSDPYGQIMVVSATLHAHLDEKGTHLMTGYYQLRPGVFFELYVEKALWVAYLNRFPPKRDPEQE